MTFAILLPADGGLVLAASHVAASRGGALEVVLGLLLVAALVPTTLIDLEHRVIPNGITAPAAAAALAAAVVLEPAFIPEQLAAAAAAGGFFLLAAWLHPGGMGMGDVKLAAVLGLCLGRAVGPAIVVALLTGALAGALIVAREGVSDGRKTTMPFGPFLALGGLVALFAGDALVDAYLERL